MSDYELSILAGSVCILIGLLFLVASLNKKSSAVLAVLFLAGGGGLMYYAHISNFSGPDISVSIGLNAADIPNALYKLIGQTLN
ncbi:MAG: hypothetical protein JKY31_12755 [Rhodobacteraceae bacterium]|nr:hypothetical protein [Paracoccaceae bacterium]